MPAQLRLKALERAALQPVNRLIPNLEVPFFQRMAQLPLTLLLACDMHFQLFVEDLVASAPSLLGAIHGAIRVPDQHLGSCVIRSCHCRAHAGVGLHGVSKDIEGPLHLLRNSAGHDLQIGDR